MQDLSHAHAGQREAVIEQRKRRSKNFITAGPVERNRVERCIQGEDSDCTPHSRTLHRCQEPLADFSSALLRVNIQRFQFVPGHAREPYDSLRRFGDKYNPRRLDTSIDLRGVLIRYPGIDLPLRVGAADEGCDGSLEDLPRCGGII